MTYVRKIVKDETDSRIKFRRPEDDSVYCVMSPATVARYRKAKTLDSFLTTQRESGIVIRTIRD